VELEIFEIQKKRLNLAFASWSEISFSRFSQKLSILRHILLHNTYINVAIAVILKIKSLRPSEAEIESSVIRT
jgi:hypothetical protein